MLDIAVVQFEPKFGECSKNVDTALKLMKSKRADIYVLPELFLSGYTFKSRDELKELAIDANTSDLLEPLRKFSINNGVAICAGYAETVGDKYFNSSFFMDEGKIVANYQKTHLFWNEKTFFEPGETGFNVFEYKGAKLGMKVCFDWFFPEATRTLMLKGAEIVLHPSNLVLDFCQRAMFARALENRVFIVTVNRIGTEVNGELENTFTGGSQVVSPKGEYLVELSKDSEGIEVVSVDPKLAADKKMTPMNSLLSDLRPKMYR